MINKVIQHVNSRRYSLYLLLFNLLVVFHFSEHLAQIGQVYIFHWERSRALGFLGLYYPTLVKSELLHYIYALIMVVGLFMLKYSIVGEARKYWDLAYWLAFYHHIEHTQLLVQATVKYNWFGSSSPVTLVQYWLGAQRIELHFFYNLMVLIPMAVALYKRSKSIKP